MTGIKTKDLTDRAMLVSLNIKQWNVTKKDKQATQTIQNEYQNETGWAKGSKHIASKKALSEVMLIVSNARQFHMTYTSPWSDEGGYRILAATNYNFYTDKMREFHNQFVDASNKVIADYPAIKAEAKIALGKLYSELEYPDTEKLAEKFKFSVSVSPMPNADDFRITQISDEDIADIRNQITNKLQESQKMIMKDLWERLYDVVEKAATTFSDPDARFHDSKIDNISEMIGILKKLNMDNDPALDRMCKVVEQRIVSLDPAEIRKEPEARKDAAETAKGILDRIASYM